MLTDNQKAILNFLKTGEKTKAQIVQAFSHWHYANSNKYIGDMLSRMVRANEIIRVKKGLYSLNLHLQKNSVKTTSNIQNQLTIF